MECGVAMFCAVLGHLKHQLAHLDVFRDGRDSSHTGLRAGPPNLRGFLDTAHAQCAQLGFFFGNNDVGKTLHQKTMHPESVQESCPKTREKSGTTKSCRVLDCSAVAVCVMQDADWKMKDLCCKSEMLVVKPQSCPTTNPWCNSTFFFLPSDTV